MLSIIKNVSSKITEKTLEALGFVNVPKGEWEFRSTAKGYTYSKNANTIPLIKTSFNAVSSKTKAPANTETTTTYNINGVKIALSKGNPGSTVDLWAFGSIIYNVYLPYFYGYDYTKLQTCTYTDILEWYEKVS